MISSNFKKAMKIIQKELNAHKIRWALIGSTNMRLQGMAVQPRDLDIVVQLKDLDRIPEIFSAYNPSDIRELPPMTGEPGWEVKININDAEIQILGERDTGEYVSKLLADKIIRIKYENMEVPCFTLEAEAQAYTETDREHKARMIREFLKQIK